MTNLAINNGSPVRTAPWPKWPEWGDAERSRVIEILDSGEWGGYHPAVAEFEAAFAQRHAARHCIAAANGTLTLEASLRVLGVGPGDEVVVPPYTFIATANAVRLVGATPVFADIEPDTYNLDMAAVEAALSPRCKAVIAVHFAGLPVDMDALLALAAQAQPCRHRRRAPTPTAARGAVSQLARGGDIGSFSLQSTKNLTAGEGGILLTNDDALADGLWRFVNQGRSRDWAVVRASRPGQQSAYYGMASGHSAGPTGTVR